MRFIRATGQTWEFVIPSALTIHFCYPFFQFGARAQFFSQYFDAFLLILFEIGDPFDGRFDESDRPIALTAQEPSRRSHCRVEVVDIHVAESANTR